uniref:Uncharacterized protein n=1 Tax=Oryza glumipatula TaxID=40148 RepID=A0A0D9YXA0_9ORYZ
MAAARPNLNGAPSRRITGGPTRANNDYVFGRGNPPGGIVEVSLLPRQGALVLWTDDDSVFGIATFVRASFLSLRIVVVLLARWRSVSHSDGRFGAWLPSL